MKVTFPHMGNAHIAIKSLLEGLKLEVVPPPPITNKTLELGIKYSPEFACMPLKINIGNFIEALEKGADTIVMAGGWGPCRFGYYAQVERDILQDLGYRFDMIILEAPDFKFTELFQQLKSLGENVSFLQAARVIRFAWQKLNAVEKIEQGFEFFLPRVIDKDKAEKIYHRGLEAVNAAISREELDHAYETAVRAWQDLEQHRKKLLRIGLVGEIYTVLEPSTNYNIVQFLGRMEVDVVRSIYLSDWVNDHICKGLVKKAHRPQVIRSARPYLNYWVGGHGQETVGSTVEMARNHLDGVIQIGPLTCMPEIVAHSILGKVAVEENIPCMTLYFDEHAGNAGVHTRLEAFADMLRRKKSDRSLRKEEVTAQSR
ncbi:MAG: CoA protein activase [Syntrophomonadaceae bacterium]|jgi:predicted nucleotide-binding protein (sugar kinase/HSP70/actin superfamily)